jgi:hypothetical protein
MSDMFSEKVKFLMPKLQKDLKITKEQAAGIIGGLAAETGGFRHMQELKPIGRGRGGWGWAQWTGQRRRTFEKKFGVGNRSDEANYGMLVHELKNDPYWSKELTRIKKAKTVAAASRAFTGSAREGRGYLRPGAEHYAESEIWAKKALQIFAQPLAKKSRNKSMAEEHEAEVTEDAWKELDDAAEKETFDMFEKTLQQIALVRVVEVDEVNTMKLRAVINSAQDVLNWKKTT